jgi:hypothetical protein
MMSDVCLIVNRWHLLLCSAAFETAAACLPPAPHLLHACLYTHVREQTPLNHRADAFHLTGLWHTSCAGVC